MSRIEAIAAAAPDAVVEDSLGQAVVRVPRGSLAAVAAAARDAGFTMFLDLCGVDYLTRDPRFEVVVHLLAMDPPERVRLLAGVPGDDPTVPSITGVFAGADFYEREAFDLFGIVFDGHPDLTRLLLPDEWQGHPLRKDSPVGSVPVQFKATSDGTFGMSVGRPTLGDQPTSEPVPTEVAFKAASDRTHEASVGTPAGQPGAPDDPEQVA